MKRIKLSTDKNGYNDAVKNHQAYKLALSTCKKAAKELGVDITTKEIEESTNVYSTVAKTMAILLSKPKISLATLM